MNFVITVHLKRGVQELFLPGVQNRTILPELNPEITGGIEAALLLDVFDDVWTIRPNSSVMFKTPETLKDGLRIDASLPETGEEIVIFVEALNLNRTRFKKYKIPSSETITVGRDPDNIIQYNTKGLVTGKHCYIEPSPGGATLVDISRNGSFINGIRVNSRQALQYGDIIYVIGLKIVWLGDTLAVNLPVDGCTVSGLTPITAADTSDDEPPLEYEFYSRSPRQMPKINNDKIEIDAPPGPPDEEKQPLWMRIGPALTMVLPMSVGILFTSYAAQQTGMTMGPFMFMGLFTSITAAVIGVFWALTNARHQKKQSKEKEAIRLKRYSDYLDRMEREISEKHAFNRTSLCKGYPHVSECMRWIVMKDRHLWERNVNHTDFLTVRLGMGQIPSPNEIAVPKNRFSLIDDKLAERPFEIHKKYEFLYDVPICLSVYEHKLIGIIGDSRNVIIETARLFAAQISVFHSYTDVRMVFIVPNNENWGFSKWLPHVWSEDNSIRMIANDQNSVGEVLYHLSTVIRNRSDDDRQDSGNLPHYVVFIADPNLVENEATIKHILSVEEDIGFSTLLFYDRLDRLPNQCTVIVQRDSEYNGFYSLDNAFAGFDGMAFDYINASQMEEMARMMSDIKVREAEGSGAIPQMMTFLDMYKTSNVEGIDVYRNWLENRTYESMKALIGARGGGTPVYLDVHEKYHGPHGLVAGTTGSGKSETLQTYILSLAVTYHPYEVSFILIDYKGGGMAESFKNLTHVAGIITNLGGNQTNRALASIRSEIKRRQAVFNEYKIKHIDDYIELFREGKAGDPMPHLLIIADEFAELKKEQPEFVRELVSASRVGRSLGVHLILATQKPDGVVDEQIWSNTKFRLCLRVAEKADSMGMLKHPEAAYITIPGRGYFQVGNDEIFEEFQSGWSGARYEPDIPFADDKGSEVKMINLWGKSSVVSSKGKKATQSGEKIIQLDVVTSYVAKIAEQHGINAVSNVWLPPLPRQLYLEDLDKIELDERELSTPVGILDDPVHQEQRPVAINFTQNNHTIVVSSTSGGKTTFLQTVLYGLVINKTPDQLHIYIADYGSRTLGIFAELPHVGGVVFDDNPDRTEKMIAMIIKEMLRRKERFAEKNIGSFKEYSKRYDDVPSILFVIDNLPAFMDNNEKQEENIFLLAREAASYGIYLLMSCTNYGDVRGRLRQNIRFGIGIQLPGSYEYFEVVGVRGEITAEDGCPGRGLIRVDHEDQKEPASLEFQTALCLKTDDPLMRNDALSIIFKEIAEGWTGSIAPNIPEVPKDMTFEAFLGYPYVDEAIKEGLLPVGFDLREATLYTIKPDELFCYAITGASRTGKTNAIMLLAKQATMAGCELYLVDDQLGKLAMFAKEHDINNINTADQIFQWLQDTIVPEFSRRNQKIKEAGGRKFAAQALADEKQIIILIHSFGDFLSTVYSDTRDMHSFLEAMVKSGNDHKIALFAVITRDDSTIYSTRPVYSGFTSWKTGIHLGGQTDNQRIFEFDMSHAEQSKKHLPGTGHTIHNDKLKQIIMPEL